MQRYRKWIVFGLLAAAATLTCVAWADDAGAYPGQYWPWLPIDLGGLLLAEALVWLFEAFVYRKFAGLTWRRAWLTSLVANLASFLLGQVGVYLTGVAGVSLLSNLGVSTALTLAVELPIVWAMNRDHPNKRRLLGVALVANLISLPALWALLYALAVGLTALSVRWGG